MTDKDFLKAVLRLMPLASDDSTRYHICGVWVTVKDGKLELHVTDGHRAMIEVVELSEPILRKTMELADIRGFLIPRDAVPSIKAFLKFIGKFGACEVKYDSGKLVLMSMESRSEIKVETECNYPDMYQFLPSSLEDHTTTLSFNAHYLSEIAKALESKVGIVKVHMKDPTSPLIITCGDKQAVLMPCRI